MISATSVAGVQASRRARCIWPISRRRFRFEPTPSTPNSCHTALRRMLFGAPMFLAHQCKNPRLSGGGFWLREPDDYLLSHGNPHYHRRRVVSRSCSGWEGVGPTRYGHQAKGVVLLAWPTEPILEEAVILSCVYHTREFNMSLWIATGAFARRRSTRQTCYRIKPYGQLVSVS